MTSERLSQQTRALVSSSIKRLLGESAWNGDLELAGCPTLYSERLHEVLVRVKQQYDSAFVRMCNMLKPTDTTAYPQFVGVTRELFKEKITWGRIVTLIAFGVRLGAYFIEHGMAEMVQSVIAWIQRLADSDLLVWMHQQGGWESFCTAFSSQANNCDSNELLLGKLSLWGAAFCAFVYIGSKVI